MPVCRCHSLDSLETPLLSHREVFELVTISALELTSTGTKRTEEERTVIHNRLMKLQEEFLRLIGERLQVYRRYLRSRWRSSERQVQKFE
jgi:hypothetical protein